MIVHPRRWLAVAAIYALATATFVASRIALRGRPDEASSARVGDQPAASRRAPAVAGGEPGATSSSLPSPEAFVAAPGRAEEVSMGHDEARAVSEPDGSPGAAILGRVVDATTDAPIERFGVGLVEAGSALDWHESSSGDFRIEGLSPGRHTVVAWTDGYFSATSGPLALKAGQEVSGILLRLRSGVTIRGKVVDASTRDPIENARLNAHDATRDPTWSSTPTKPDAVTAADGTFELLGGLRRGGLLRVTVRHDGYLAASSAPIETAVHVVELPPIALRRGGAIEGMASRSDGKPIAGGDVFASFDGAENEPSPPDPFRTTKTDPDGSFRLVALEPGAWNVRVMSMDDPNSTSETMASVSAGGTTRVDLRPSSSGCTIEGRVHRGGEALRKVGVSLFLTHPDGSSRGKVSRSAKTDDGGRFVMHNVPAGEGQIHVLAFPGFGSDSDANGSFTYLRPFTVPDTPRMEANVELPAGGDVAGRVRHKADDTPVADISVDAQSIRRSLSDGLFHASTQTDEAGVYRIQNLPPGRYRIDVGTERRQSLEMPHEHAVEAQTVEVVAGETAPADFAIESGAPVVIEVLAPDGARAGSCFVALHRENDPDPGKALQVRANDAGLARIELVAAGRYVVQAQAQGFPVSVSDPISVDGIKESRISVRLQAGKRLRVRAVGPDGNPAPIDQLLAADERRYIVGFADTKGSNGAVELIVPRGKLKVTAVSGKLRTTIDVEVGHAPPPEVVVKLEEAGKGVR